MALSDENNGVGTTMLVGPANGGGMGFGNNDLSLFMVLFFFCMFGGGWGNFGGYGNNQLSYDFPWMLNGQNGINDNINAQFAQAATQSAIGDLAMAVNTGFGNIGTQLCGGFGGVNANIANGFAQAEIAENARQMANMNQMFGLQTALAGYNAETNNNISAGIQRVLDQMCQDKIDAKNDTIAQLRSELMYARGQASQDVQTAAIQAGQRVLANEIEQYVAPKAMPAYMVQNPNCCPNTCGGCGMM